MNEADPVPAEPTSNDDAEVSQLACKLCGAVRTIAAGYCGDCGYIFEIETASTSPATIPTELIGGRYRLLQLIGERGGVARFRGEDVGTLETPFPVVILRQAAATPSEEQEPTTTEAEPEQDGSRPEFDLPVEGEQPTLQMPLPADSGAWPGVAWEHGVLLRAAHLSLPRLIDSFTEDEFSYLIEEVPAGTALWDAWDRDGISNRERFTWIIQIAEAVERLHFAGAILEGLRPEMIVVSQSGIAILADLADLLPIPFPGDIPLRGGFSTAPELLLHPDEADERADLYAFGALLYALMLGRELTDLDFTLTGMPRPYLERVPDANPYLARVMAKTFVRDVARRFPTDDGAQVDPTGFRELIAALDACRRNMDRHRIDVAAWSTTGMVRTGNEDAVVTYHSSDALLDDADERALVLLADGMGGMECGEVAATLTLETLRECLLAQSPFGMGLPTTPLPTEPDELQPNDRLLPDEGEESEGPPTLTLHRATESPLERTTEAYGEHVLAALREANRRVFEAARDNVAARGMGCTAEVVLVDGPICVVGHVGDSRVYRMHKGKLAQVTKDQTIVSRLLELGQITAEEAETHPRRSELQQAIGGRPEVYPDILAVTLEAGDWLVVCSDGLSNQATLETIQATLRESKNAEKAARRLVNMVLADGAMDNVTVAVLRFS